MSCFVEELTITYSKSPHTDRCTVIPKGMHCVIDVYLKLVFNAYLALFYFCTVCVGR